DIPVLVEEDGESAGHSVAGHEQPAIARRFWDGERFDPPALFSPGRPTEGPDVARLQARGRDRPLQGDLVVTAAVQIPAGRPHQQHVAGTGRTAGINEDLWLVAAAAVERAGDLGGGGGCEDEGGQDGRGVAHVRTAPAGPDGREPYLIMRFAGPRRTREGGKAPGRAAGAGSAAPSIGASEEGPLP